jgi:hypothetical protein
MLNLDAFKIANNLIDHTTTCNRSNRSNRSNRPLDTYSEEPARNKDLLFSPNLFY